MVMLERQGSGIVLYSTVFGLEISYRTVHIKGATELAHAVVNENDGFKRSLCPQPAQQAPRRTAGSFFGRGQASVRKEGLCRGHAGRRGCALWRVAADALCPLWGKAGPLRGDHKRHLRIDLSRVDPGKTCNARDR